MEQNETGCQTPQATILCVNNCGFFGTPATLNMCSKCYKDVVLKQERAELAASSFQSIINGSSKNGAKVLDAAASVIAEANAISSDSIEASRRTSSESPAIGVSDEANKQGPKRCGACNKRVGLTGFNCRCGSMFCGVHRYSDKHDCPFDYHAAGQEAIAKANPVVKAEKLDKI
ncbi:hypothetical protein ACP275_14G171400 [Erythranthe tilingii]